MDAWRALSVLVVTALGLRELNLLTFMQGYGSSAGQMVQYAAMAVANGLANYVCCVFGDSPLQEGVRTGAAYAGGGRRNAMAALPQVYGFAGALPMYALAAQRHMDLFGTTQEQRSQIYYLDDGYDLAIEGTHGSMDDIERELNAFVLPYAMRLADEFPHLIPWAK